MNRFIRRIGDVSARRPWTTIGAWAVLAALVVALSGALGGAFADDFSAPGSESAEAMELLEERFPEAAGGTAVAVFAARRRRAAGRLPAGHRLGAVPGRGDRARRHRERPVRDGPDLGGRADRVRRDHPGRAVDRVRPRHGGDARRRPRAGPRRRADGRVRRRRRVPQRRGGVLGRRGGRPRRRARRPPRRLRDGRGRPRADRARAGRRRRRAQRHRAAGRRPDRLHRRADDRRDGRTGRRHRLRAVHRLPLPREPRRRAGQRAGAVRRHGLVRHRRLLRRRHRGPGDGRARADRCGLPRLHRARHVDRRAVRGGDRDHPAAGDPVAARRPHRRRTDRRPASRRQAGRGHRLVAAGPPDLRPALAVPGRRVARCS